MLTAFFQKPVAARRISLLLVTLVMTAWGLLIAWQRSPYTDLLGHEALADHHNPFAIHLIAFLISWLLMIVAMMIPVNLPVLVDIQHDRQRDFWAALPVILGYLIPWVLFGLLVFLGDQVLHTVAGPTGPLEMASGFIAPALILAAGIYQRTPFKRRFIERCRSSKNGGMPDHRGQMGGAWYHSTLLGINCVGSCWSLMLLMFALGHHRLDWMLVLGGIAAAERLTPLGHRLAGWVGLALIVWAVYSIAASANGLWNWV